MKNHPDYQRMIAASNRPQIIQFLEPIVFGLGVLVLISVFFGG